MGKPAFHEDYHHEHADPMDNHSIVEFDWDELMVRLGEAQTELAPRDYTGLVEALRSILDWMMPSHLHRDGCDRTIGRRAIALAWAMNPALFENSPSLSQIAKDLGLGKATMSTYTAEASRRFQVRNRGQNHGWNWRKSVESAQPTKPAKPVTAAKSKRSPNVPHSGRRSKFKSRCTRSTAAQRKASKPAKRPPNVRRLGRRSKHKPRHR